MNIRAEYMEETENKEVKCAWLRTGLEWRGEELKTHILKTGYTDADLLKFLASIDYEYDDGFGSQELEGNIWYEDGTWSERHEYDGSENWSYSYCPKIPDECINPTNIGA